MYGVVTACGIMRAIDQMNRVAPFLRSVLPADPWHLIFLVGVVFVFVCGHASWWSEALLVECGAPFGDPSFSTTFGKFRQFTIVVVFLTIFCGVAGYFLCFWPGKKQLQRVFWFAWAPAAIGLTLFLSKLYGLCTPASVLHLKYDAGSFIGWLKANAAYLPAGPVLSAAGLALILVFAARLACGKSALPLEIGQTSDQAVDERWMRTRHLTFVLIGPYFVLMGLVGFLLFSPGLFLHRAQATVFFGVFSDLSPILEAAVLIGTALAVLKVSWRNIPGTYVRLPKLRDAAVAFAIPVGAMLLLPAGHYLFDRVQWAAHEFGRYSPPEAATYFDVSNLLHLSAFLALFASTAEEIVFRGMLLPEFVGRYGTQRGIFFVGIVWAAIHLRSDSYSGMSFAGVLVQMVVRVAFCLALNFVLSWMTLRQGSITSAAICHGVWNLLNFLPQRGVDVFPGHLEIKIALIGVVAIVLFRFWPIKDERPTSASEEGTGPVPVT